MPETIVWSLDVQVTGGPNQSLAQALTVDAYDVLNVSVPAQTGTTPGTVDVDVQPSPTGKVQFLLITSTAYDSGGNLEYQVKVASAQKLNLDGPQLMVNAGLVKLLGSQQKTFTFTNKLTEPVSISILVGRNATS